MPLTDQEKGRLRHLWRELAGLAIAREVAQSEAFRRQAVDAPNWASPLDHDADAFVLFGFARLAKSLARSRVDDAARRAPLLTLVAAEVLHMLDAPAPDPDPAPSANPLFGAASSAEGLPTRAAPLRLPYADD